MRRLALVLVLGLVAASAAAWPPWGNQTGWHTGDGWRGPAGTGTTVDLNGQIIAFADECTTTKTIYTEAPYIPIAFTRASSAWCTRSDGSMVLLSTDQPRRERLGLYIEPASSGNGIVDPRDLTTGSWTRSNITAAKTAIGPDGAANSASTITATATDGTVKQTVTIASARRSSSMRMKRRTGTGAVYVTRDDFGTQVDIASELSTTQWKWVRATCGNDTASMAQWFDTAFDEIPNCIAVSALTATAANPTIGIKIGVSGDAVDVDMVQDEASSFATSPQTGFTRAADVMRDTANKGLLPVEVGEVSIDATTIWTADGQSGDRFLVDTRGGSTCGLWIYPRQDTGSINGRTIRTSTAASSATVGAPLYTAVGRNTRLSFGGGSWVLWTNGRRVATTVGGIPDCHTDYWIGSWGSGNGVAAAWISRVKWSSGAALSDFKGSTALAITVGDSIVTGDPNAMPDADERPTKIFASAVNYSLSTDKYVLNDGLSGRTAAGCATQWAAHIAAAQAAGTESRTVLVLQCGTNGVGAGAAATWATIEPLLDDAVAAGIGVVPATITPTPSTVEETAFRTLILAWCTANNVECADTYAVMDDPLNPGEMRAEYHPGGDSLHPNGAGSAVMAAEWARAGSVMGYW